LVDDGPVSFDLAVLAMDELADAGLKLPQMIAILISGG
jgi:hypothetical protein